MEGEPPGVHYSAEFCHVVVPVGVSCACTQTSHYILHIYIYIHIYIYLYIYIYIYICATKPERLNEPPRTSKRKRTVPVFSKVGDFNHCLQFSGEIFGPREETSAGNIEICC